MAPEIAWDMLQLAITNKPQDEDDAPLLRAARFLLATGPLPERSTDKVPGTETTFAKACELLHEPIGPGPRPDFREVAGQRQALAAAVTAPRWKHRTNWSRTGGGTSAAAGAVRRNMLVQFADMNEIETHIADWMRSHRSPVADQQSSEPSPESRDESATDHFVGRDLFLQRLTDSRFQFINVYGDPGMGKSRVVDRWAAINRSEFPDGVLRLGLDGFSAEEPVAAPEAARRLLIRLGVDAATISDDRGMRFDQLGELLRGSKRLLILDNVASAVQILDLLRSAGTARVLITSRSPLGDIGAHLRLEALQLEGLSADESSEYFESAVEPDLLARNRTELDKLIDRIAGLPLALELVAGRLRDDPGSINEINLISGDVKAAFDWSYQPLIDAQKQLLWTIAAVPQRHVERELQKALTGSKWDADDLWALIHRGLVHVGPDGHATLHDLVRDYAVANAYQAGVASHAVALKAVEWEYRRLEGLIRALGVARREGVPDASFALIGRFDSWWPGIDDCLAWLRHRPNEGQWHAMLTHRAGTFLLLKGDWKTYLRDAIPAHEWVRDARIDFWIQPLYDQLTGARRDAREFVDLPGLGEPAAAAVARIDEVFGRGSDEFHWRRQRQYDRWATVDDFMADFRQVQEDSSRIRPFHFAHVLPQVRERLEALAEPVATISELVAAWSYWANNAYYELVTNPTVDHENPALSEAIEWFESWLDFVSQFATYDLDAQAVMPRMRVLLSTLYGLQGRAGSDKDLQQLRSARDRYLEREDWVPCFVITRRLEELEPGSAEESESKIGP